MRKPPLHRSFGHAARGILQMLRSERNFRIETGATLLNLLLVFAFRLDGRDAAIIILCCFSVLSAEIFNTAVEKICDLVQPDYDERVKFIKDISAGAVLILTISAVIVGVAVYSKCLFYKF